MSAQPDTRADRAIGGAFGDAGLAVVLDRVAKQYPGGVTALREVSVEIEAGEQVAVIGPSGSGKTTMLTILGTLSVRRAARFTSPAAASATHQTVSWLGYARTGSDSCSRSFTCRST